MDRPERRLEMGAVTGELELFSRVGAGVFDVSVRYAGAEEWYPTITGSPVSLDDASRCTRAHLLGRVVSHLTRPGPTVDGNEEPVSLVRALPCLI